MINYPAIDSSLPFAKYVAECQALIETRRPDLQQKNLNRERIIHANTPFELYPAQPVFAKDRLKYGALLLHGLFDCPFSLRDIAEQLQTHGILCRSILLPGHGTVPDDLLSITYQDWIQAMRYGVASLRQEVDHLFMIGYSTGAALSIFHALQDANLAGIILLAPAIKIKAPIDTIFGWESMVKWISDNKQWIYREDEIDYAKYLSIAFNPIAEVNKLTDIVAQLHHHQALTCPVLMSVSLDDETISSQSALTFFSQLPNQNNKLLLYASRDYHDSDPRIITRQTQYADLHIQHFSHVSLPFAPTNSHYGQHGDYRYASHLHDDTSLYGAYNHIEEDTYQFLYNLGVVKQKRCSLTYNPDFNFMAEEMVKFILTV